MDKAFASASGDGMQGPGTSRMDKAMVVKGKRPFKKIGQKKWRKFVCSVVLEALKLGPVTQQLCAMMEPMLRKVVAEVIENTLPRFVYNGQISLPRQIKCAGSRTFRLHFKSELPNSIFTQSIVKDYQGLPVRIELQDRATGEVVTTGQESAAKLEVVTLEGGFNNDDNEDWYQEDFETHVVKEREGKGPLLTGNLTIVLKEGVGTLGDVTFTDNSGWTTSKNFMLGVRVAGKSSKVLSVREGKSGTFQVKEHRGTYYGKHHPPAPNDDVWRLEKIRKDGPYHKKLNNNGIQTVEQFHRSLMMGPQKLRGILGPRISDKMWQDIVKHVQTCNFSDKRVEYTSVELVTNNNKLVNDMYETSSKIDSGKMLDSEKLDELRGVGGHGKEREVAIQFCNGNPAASTRYAVQDQQSAQHVPIIPAELVLSDAVPGNEGFVMSTAVEPSKCIMFPFYDLSSPPLPQISLGESEEFSRLLDEILPKNTEQDENGEVVPVFQSFAFSPADTFGGVSLGNSSERCRKLRAVFLCVLWIRKIQGQKSRENE